MFNVHIQSKLLQRMPVMGTGPVPLSGTVKKGGGSKHWWEQASTSSPTEIDSRQRVV